MLFNLDRNTKQSILNEYKQEALNYRQKKNEERERRIQEERAYLAQREQMDKEANDKLIQEKLQRRNKQMEEYHSMLNMQNSSPHPGFRVGNLKKRDVVINNWGGQDKYQQPNKNENYTPHIRQMSPQVGQFFQNEDHMGNYLTDEQNNKEVNDYFRSEREYKKNAYRDLLYSQYQKAKERNLSLYGTDDPLILERKRKKYLSENPFAKKSNYEFGESSLARNPILDPQNNMNYNKYLRFSGNSNRNNSPVMINSNSIPNMNISINNNSQIDNINNNKAPLSEQQRENYNQNNIDLMNNDTGIINRNNNFNTISFQDNKNSFNNNGNDNCNYNQGEENNNCGRRLYNSNTVNNYSRNGNMDLFNGQNSNYCNNNNFVPTPSGQRIRQAAASNFL